MAKFAVVTAGATGIGAGIVSILADAGYDVAFTYHNSEKAAQDLIERFKESVKLVAIKADLTSRQGIVGFTDQIVALDRPIDLLVNNYGIADSNNDGYDANPAKVTFAFDNTVFVTMYVIAQLRDHMAEAGSIVNIASIYGLENSSSRGLPLYSAAKAALINYSKSLAAVCAPAVRVNVVAPGFTRTPHWEDVAEERRKACIDSTLLKKWVQPEDIGQTVLFLAENTAITAQVITVDAGWSKR